MMRLPAVLLLSIVLGGCTWGVPIGDRGKQQSAGSSNGGVPSTKPSKRGNPSSYVVFGKRYYVLDSAEGFTQRGIASWYGTKFHGRPTSSGEIYNMHAMTAAHKTLPIPVYVHVKNLDNGRSMVVKVNDRGPFVAGRIIDLSYAAAKKLGVDIPGTANVEIRVVGKGTTRTTTVAGGGGSQKSSSQSAGSSSQSTGAGASKKKTTTPTQSSGVGSGQGSSTTIATQTRTMADSVARGIPLATGFEDEVPLYIQMGTFASLQNADNLMQDLIAQNEKAVQISHFESDNGRLYRVRVGPLFDIDEANAILARLRGKGFQTAHIVVQDEIQ